MTIQETFNNALLEIRGKAGNIYNIVLKLDNAVLIEKDVQGLLDYWCDFTVDGREYDMNVFDDYYYGSGTKVHKAIVYPVTEDNSTDTRFYANVKVKEVLA